ANLDTYTLLDTLFAQAKWADKLGAVYSELNEKGTRLYFKDARHPLIEEEKVVSNTYEIAPPNRHLLISGSNTGGKTVTLKTIGLFTIMTMSGLPIPCEEAIVPLFDDVFVDVGDFQSILESLSTFSAHLSRLSTILNKASSRSLVLLDELGSGTDPSEGECLAIAILEYLREHKIMSVATTHYSKVKEYAKTQDEILMSSVGFNLDTMTPTYKYMSGFSGNSNALEIAKRYHIKDEILEYAYKLREASYSDQERLIEKLEKDRMELLDQQTLLKNQQEQLEKEKQNLISTQAKQQETQDKLLKEAYAKAEQVIDDAKEQAKSVIDELRSMKQVKEHEIIEAVSKLKTETMKEDPLPEVVETFALHDYVKVKGLQYQGEIISLKGNKATISTNGMRMNVKVSDLTHTHRPVKKKVASVSSSSSVARPKMECNVIGMRVSEALPVVEKYLDNALYHKMYTVTIIHGSGTGALRSAIHEMLKKQKYVKTFRLGGEFEGGLGATVVTLKGGKDG
ncbi:Smr/MutS family protein, partial [Breznakia sp. OttesenSCG-928-G09]|nr:Smr/MutS family protein [Breznakia sp. OttesenSCG-928-G09]